MLQTIWEQFQAWLGLGLNVSDVSALQMALRTIVIYAITLAIVRLGSKRFLSEASAFDVIVGIMLGSIMSRAINSSAPFLPTIAAGAVLISLHWLLAFLAFRVDWFGPIVKGNPVPLIKDGQIQEQGMRRTGLSLHDLQQALRAEGQPPDVARIQNAFLERNGSISVIPFQREPRVFVVPVEEGVQTLRIEV